MNRNLSPRSVRLAVDRALWGDGFWDVYMAVYGAVVEAVEGSVTDAVRGAVSRAVRVAVSRAVLVSPPHPNLQRFIGEIRQAGGDAA